MSRQHKVLLIFSFLLLQLGAFSQDLIIQKNGAKIRCRILDQDSVSLFYSLGEQKALFTIKKADVEEYFISNKTPVPPSENYNTTSSAKNQTRPASVPNRSLKNNEVFMLSLSGGLAAPLGKFASKDTKDSLSGLANVGALFNAAITLKFSTNVGLKLAYRYQSMPADADAINDVYKSLFAQIPGGSNLTLSTNTTNWLASGPFGGLFFSFPVRSNRELSFDLDMSAGYASCTSFGYITNISANGQLLGNIAQGKGSAGTLGLNGGVGLHYKLTDYVAFHFNMNVFYAKPTFKGLVIIETAPGGTFYDVHDYTQKITTLNFQMGLSFMVY